MEAIYIPFDKSRSVEVEDGYVIDNYLSKSNGLGYSLVCVPAFDPDDDVIYHGVFAKSEE